MATNTIFTVRIKCQRLLSIDLRGTPLAAECVYVCVPYNTPLKNRIGNTNRAHNATKSTSTDKNE